MPRSTPTPGMPPAAARRLAVEATGGRAPALANELAAAVASTSRVRAFVELHRAKIRHKVVDAADAGDAESLREVRLELLAALRLLADRRFDVAWEAAGARAGGPDFAVTWRANTPLLVEVTRRRGGTTAADTVDAGLAKLRQLGRGAPNVLVVGMDAVPPADDLAAAFAALRRRVEARDDATLARARATDPRAFFERFLRLAALVAWAPDARPGERTTTWRNAGGRFGLPDQALAALVAALGA